VFGGQAPAGLSGAQKIARATARKDPNQKLGRLFRIKQKLAHFFGSNKNTRTMALA